MGIKDTLLGRSPKQRARIDKAKADYAAQREAMRAKIAADKEQTAADWADTKAKAKAQSRGQDDGPDYS